jgi:predicted Ser/Thr protein kinase
VARAQAPKKVLILMSDTGGGHRASAEAIKSAFAQEYGDDYQVRLAPPFHSCPVSLSGFVVRIRCFTEYLSNMRNVAVATW